MFWIRCGCYGMRTGVLELVRFFWKICRCSGLVAVVRIMCGCSGEGAGVLNNVRVFWSGCGCSV